MKNNKILPILLLNVFFILCNQDNITGKQNDAIAFAREHSGTESKRDWSDIYWDHLADFISVDDYNDMINLNRVDSLRYLSDEDAWTWGTDSIRLIFRNMRIELK